MSPWQIPPLPVPSHSPPLSDTFLQRLPDSIDLIVMEWAASASNVDSARWLDDALHRVLHRWQAQQPAILLVHFFFWCRGNIGCRGYKVKKGRKLACSVACLMKILTLFVGMNAVTVRDTLLFIHPSSSPFLLQPIPPLCKP